MRQTFLILATAYGQPPLGASGDAPMIRPSRDVAVEYRSSRRHKARRPRRAGW